MSDQTFNFGNEYDLLCRELPSPLVKAVELCALPHILDDGLGYQIIHEFAKLNGTARAAWTELKQLPFIYPYEEEQWRFAQSARAHFISRLEKQTDIYLELNTYLKNYFNREHERIQYTDTPQARALEWRIAYHSAPVAPEEAVKRLRQFGEEALNSNRLADVKGVLDVFEEQNRWLSAYQVERNYFEGRYHYLRRDYFRALSPLKRVYATHQHSRSVAIAAHFLGVIYRSQHHLVEAAEVLEESIQIGRELDIRSHVVQTLNTLGTVYRDLRRLDAAVQALEEARDIATSLNDQSQRGQILNTLGTVYRDLRRPDAAVQALEEARDIATSLNDRASKAQTLNTLGTVYRDLRRLDAAVQALEESVQIGRELEMWHHTGQALNSLGIVYRLQYKYVESELVILESKDIIEQSGDKEGKAMVWFSLGQLYHQSGRLERARAAYVRSLEINNLLGNRYFVGKIDAVLQQLDDRLRSEGVEKQPSELEHDLNRRLQALDETLQTNPEDIQTRSSYISLLRKAGRVLEALEIVREGWKLTPGEPNLYNSYISILVDARQWEEAKKIVNYRLNLVPSDQKALLTLASVLERLAETSDDSMEMYQNAAKIYRGIISSDQANRNFKARAWNGLGNVLKELGDLQEAYECYLLAQRLGIHDVQVLNNLGMLYVRRAERILAEGKKREAEQFFVQAENTYLQAIKLGRSRGDFLWPFINLARLYIIRNETREAIDWLNQIDISFSDSQKNDNIRGEIDKLWKELLGSNSNTD
jgi:tetratricopeptide (TPR) repeat protein